MGVSTHSRLKAAAEEKQAFDDLKAVSTHSRLKAAALLLMSLTLLPVCFNTQPPEGGCQDPEFRLVLDDVSTHSRLKAAGTNESCCGRIQ